ncbi:saccharopine dehydrogenase-like NADP-dependent oxidoreductase [Anaerosolibacter carboniphilus]|uniref:Saccharopine dehydrogenase-like NADP-dependent oxidoreductase n=1 Tax=Anaerosolibacter carboniphilus TaxID=1417629 RepID=A0A841KNK1_9FIRM|nr:hypothetical protein [Anaerosolibacter carboniphilus]MBB6215006.1 saccharopine dehydrogenase-like NADP-dependent oxidoreductase [Anaerosolibacter carboniphilus]
MDSLLNYGDLKNLEKYLVEEIRLMKKNINSLEDNTFLMSTVNEYLEILKAIQHLMLHFEKTIEK